MNTYTSLPTLGRERVLGSKVVPGMKNIVACMSKMWMIGLVAWYKGILRSMEMKRRM